MAKPTPRLNIFHRTGVVLTAAWAIGWLCFWFGSVRDCLAGAEPWSCAYHGSGPLWTLGSELGFWRLGVWGNVLFDCVVIPAFAWLSVWIATWAARWILAGRAPT